MDAVAVALIAKYGPVGVLAVIVAVVILLMYKIDKRLVRVEDKSVSIDGVCIVREGKFTQIENRLGTLEDEDIKIEGKLTNINTNIKNLEVNMNFIGADVKTILTHFAEKGMGR